MWNTESCEAEECGEAGSKEHLDAFFSDVSCVYTIHNPYQMRCSCKYWHHASSISAEILSLCDSFCLVSREFYFDRSPRIFENILGLYRKGELHLTESVCPKAGENNLQRMFQNIFLIIEWQIIDRSSNANYWTFWTGLRRWAGVLGPKRPLPRAVLRLHAAESLLAPSCGGPRAGQG